MRINRYFYELLYHYLSVYIRPEDTCIEIDPPSPHHGIAGSVIFRKQRDDVGSRSLFREIGKIRPDYVLLNGNIHYERDIQSTLDALHGVCTASTRIVVTYYSSLWKPLFRAATWLGLRTRTPEQNWISPRDIRNLLYLSDFESVLDESKVLIPVYIPLVSWFVNRYIAPLPIFNIFCMLHIRVARPVVAGRHGEPSVSVVVPARNEAGNIESLLKRLPNMGPDDELIFVEGHSRDGTWEAIQAVQAAFGDRRKIISARQDGIGKGDAVRKGFSLASKDILMVLDADLTVPPEKLPLFYRALVCDKGEFINGSRLVYPMEEKAMRFLNMVGNKFFALAFSFVLGQKFNDTLCGTKALTRENYIRLAKHRGYFGEFDPFGDFDLIFGSSRMCLKTVEIPINYRERTYGTTNISRWKHGLLLVRMLIYAARRLKFT